MTPNEIIIEIIKEYLTEEQAEFLLNFKPRKHYTFEQLKSITELDDKILREKLDDCMKDGVIMRIANKITGVIEYFVAPYVPGFIEFMFIKNELGEKEVKIAKLNKKLEEKIIKVIQKNYEKMVPMLSNFPLLGRTVPVEELIDPGEEVVLPLQEISKILEKTDNIGVGNCFCRHQKASIGDPCKKTDLMKNCLWLGDTAKFLISQNFIEPVSKEEALKIIKDSEDAGLVHKAYHFDLDLEQEIATLCNCCDDCCGPIGGMRKGGLPLKDLTSHMAKVTEDECVGCGTCVDKCLVKAIELVDDIANVDEKKCMGCGQCAYHCPTGAMKLIKTELRQVLIPPTKL